MSARLRVALTADLHWGVRPAGDEATAGLIDFLKNAPPDVLVLAGDVGAGGDFAACLSQFDALACRKALVPGNHDIWVEADDPRGDSLEVYRAALPAVCAAHGFHYLDHGPLFWPEAGLAVAGSINWYDYSWSLDALRRELPDWEERLRTKRFSRGRHNDARFVRWPLDDGRFTAEVVAALERHLDEARARVGQVLVVTHHPPFYGLSFPPPRSADDAGRSALECLHGQPRPGRGASPARAGRPVRVLRTHAPGAGEPTGQHPRLQRRRDYHFKRLLLLDWPEGRVEAHTFGSGLETAAAAR